MDKSHREQSAHYQAYLEVSKGHRPPVILPHNKDYSDKFVYSCVCVVGEGSALIYERLLLFVEYFLLALHKFL